MINCFIEIHLGAGIVWFWRAWAKAAGPQMEKDYKPVAVESFQSFEPALNNHLSIIVEKYIQVSLACII